MRIKQPKGNSYDGSSEYIEKDNKLLIIIGILVIIGISIYFIIRHINKNNTCNQIEETILKDALNYVKENDLLPKIEGEAITIDIEEIYQNSQHRPTISNNICSGNIKFTKYKEEYIPTYDINHCSYCSTNERYKDWSKKEVDQMPKGNKIIDIIPYYNYYNIAYYHTNWSDWIPFEEISQEETNGVKLPLDLQKLPSIPEEGKALTYEKIDRTYYSYRDKKWRYYKDNGGYYSDFYSEQPDGYPNKDTSTEIETEWSNWSMNYPEKKSYRTINSTTGYRWYYEEKNKKIYWNGGEYTSEQPDEKYNKKEKQTVTLYQYRDKKWRWYSGNRRNYSSYTSEPPSKYPNRDEGLMQYTNWTNWQDTPSSTDTNSYYREEKTNIHSRYRITYTMTSFALLDQYVTKQELEEKLGKTIPELMENKEIHIDIQYKFKSRSR